MLYVLYRPPNWTDYIYMVLQGLTGIYRGLQGFTGVYRDLQGFTGIYRDLQGFTGDCKMEMAVPPSTGSVLWVDNYTLICSRLQFWLVPIATAAARGCR